MARWDTIQVDGQPMRGYLGAPDGGGAAPGVVVIMHGPGLERFMEDRGRHGKPHEFHRYAGAGHAFLNFANAERYRPDQAKDAWSKMLGFLSRHLKGGPAQ